MSFEDRLTILERAVGSMDRDISDIKEHLHANTTVLNALRETQVEQGEMLGQILTILGNGTDEQRQR